MFAPPHTKAGFESIKLRNHPDEEVPENGSPKVQESRRINLSKWTGRTRETFWNTVKAGGNSLH